jgi:hypothetical protein
MISKSATPKTPGDRSVDLVATDGDGDSVRGSGTFTVTVPTYSGGRRGPGSTTVDDRTITYTLHAGKYRCPRLDGQKQSRHQLTSTSTRTTTREYHGYEEHR